MKDDRRYKHNCAKETIWCWYGNDWAKSNTAEWVCPWQSNVSQKPKPSQTKGYAFLLLIYQICSCCLRGKQRVKGQLVLPLRDRRSIQICVFCFHRLEVSVLPELPTKVRSWRVRSTFREDFFPFAWMSFQRSWEHYTDSQLQEVPVPLLTSRELSLR